LPEYYNAEREAFAACWLEFTKFVTLMRDLAPYLLLIIDPANRNHRRDRSPTIGRRNLEFILNGHPDALHLFTTSLYSARLT
jgi:hypothetical protein